MYYTQEQIDSVMEAVEIAEQASTCPEEKACIASSLVLLRAMGKGTDRIVSRLPSKNPGTRGPF